MLTQDGLSPSRAARSATREGPSSTDIAWSTRRSEGEASRKAGLCTSRLRRVPAAAIPAAASATVISGLFRACFQIGYPVSWIRKG